MKQNGIEEIAMKVTVENTTVAIGAKEIVKSISLEAKEGEFIGLLGPNGSGKSTLLKAIYQVLPYKDGQIKINGREIKTISLKEISKEMSVVSQFNGVQFEFSVIDIVLMGRSPYLKPFQRESKEDYQIAIEALKKVGMEDALKKNFNLLSGGEKQRVVLARALAQQPELIILDEPTNHLDIKYQIHILSIVKNLGITVISALHDLSLAAQFCDRIYVMKCGKIVADGIPKEVITPEMVKQVYDIDCEIVWNPNTETLMISYYSI